MILLIRHAEKTLIGTGNLTQKGLDDASNYGKELTQQGISFDRVISSPIKRCVQTSENIIKGMGSAIKIQESTLLGNPGIFVTDDQQAGKVFETLSVCTVINHTLQGKVLPGFLPIDKACKKLINEIQTQIDANKSSLYVSHDAIIMPFIGYILKINQFTEAEIVDYLNGYTIKKTLDGLCVRTSLKTQLQHPTT